MQQTRFVQPSQILTEMLLTVQVQGLRHASSQGHRTARPIWRQACLAAAIASPAQTITTFEASGAGTSTSQGTECYGINTAGTIAGLYRDAKNVYHGFVRTATGTITTFSAAGAGTAKGQGTTAVGINTAGEIAGYYENASSVRYGFERAADGKITSFQADASTT
jgi:hypothetical protein